MADVYDRWRKSHPEQGERECGEHSSRTRPMVPTADHGVGKRWQVRYRDANGAQRKENYAIKAAADSRAAALENELRGGTYVDPAAGKVTLSEYARQWLGSGTAGPTTSERYEGVIRNHIAPRLSGREVRTLNKPSAIQAWVKQLQAAGLEASTISGYSDVLEDIDFGRSEIRVNRQIRMVRNKPVFALPKGNRIRSIPMPAGVAKELRGHRKRYPPVAVTLP